MRTVIQDLPDIVLASESPWRREMFGWLGLKFRTAVSGFPEEEVKWDEFDDPHAFVRAISTGKAMSASIEEPESIVITADSSVFLNEKNYGKPQNLDEARVFLQEQSGQLPVVVTAVSVYDPSTRELAVESIESSVRLMSLTPETIERLIASGEPLGKAGGFDILGEIRPYIEEIEGSPSSIIGLPLLTIKEMLEDLGISIDVDIRTSIFQKTGYVEPV